MNVAVVTLREILDLRRWSVAFFVASVIVCFAVSPMALGAVGVNYGSAGGAAWQKIHPATYLMALSMGFGFLGLPRRWAFLGEIPSRLPGVSFFTVMWALLTIFAAAVQHSPLTQLLDTFFIAAAALVIYDELPERVRSFVRIFLHVFLCVNAIIGVAEFFLHWRMFPLILDGEEMTDERRSTALIGHPLQNAAASGAYLLCLFFGGDAALHPVTRLMLMMVQILGLACFGGRTSIAAASLIIAANLAKDFAFILLGARFDMRRALGVVLVGPLLIVAALYAVSAGAFEDVIARFLDDNGSAEARVIMFRLFESFELRDLLIAPDPEVVGTLLRNLGIRVGIENTWISWIFQYGAMMTLFFMLGLVALLWELWRRSQAGALQLLLFFVVLMSSAIGLASKSMIFNHLVLLMLFVFGKQASEAKAPLPAVEPGARSSCQAVLAKPELGLGVTSNISKPSPHNSYSRFLST